MLSSLPQISQADQSFLLPGEEDGGRGGRLDGDSKTVPTREWRVPHGNVGRKEKGFLSPKLQLPKVKCDFNVEGKLEGPARAAVFCC